MTAITPGMIDALLHEIEEPLITAEELAEACGMTRKNVSETAKKLKIQCYTVKEGNYYKSAYDMNMVTKLIDEFKKKNAVIRKNKLDITKLLRKD